MTATLALLLSFALGAVLGGQLAGRLRRTDLRRIGSGNLGATNALRAGGPALGLAVLAFDAGKGWLAASQVPALSPETIWLPWACGGAAILGHVYSPLAGFHGGKGAATGIGACLALLPIGLAVGLAGFLPCLLLTGYVSLSILLAASLVLLWVTCFAASGIFSFAGAFAVGLWLLLAWTHRDNLRRLLQGRENRFEKVMLIRPRRG